MKKGSITLTAILFVISIGNCMRLLADGNVKTVEVLSIFAVGVLAGVLVIQIVIMTRKSSIEKI